MAILPPPVGDVGAEALNAEVLSLGEEVEFLKARVEQQDQMLAAKDQTIAELTKKVPSPGDETPWWEFWRGCHLG